MPESSCNKRIKALDVSVVNRIAAGEIIIAPANALKEMLENSIDAGATSIDILTKDGGLKLMQITDNGSGINRDDMAILCKRFTTSKLSTFEDLSSIATYGFRGEALASISHISHLTVTTKTKDSACAWKASYSNGELLADTKRGNSSLSRNSGGEIVSQPKATAGKNGTQIIVEDLFFNVPSRLRVFKSSSEEYSKILDVVSRYAIHTKNVAFSCKKYGDSHASLTIPYNYSVVDRIRVVYGSSVASELLPLSSKANEQLGLLKISGFITNPNYNGKRNIMPVLFINNRSVSCDPLRKAVNAVYSAYLPKGGHSFVYIALEIVPKNVDVNVHPTKREVRFLYEDEIIEIICESLQTVLAGADSSRKFQTQTVLPGAISISSNRRNENTPSLPKKKVYENKMIRTDSTQGKITTLFASSSSNTRVSSQESISRPYAPYLFEASAKRKLSSMGSGSQAFERGIRFNEDQDNNAKLIGNNNSHANKGSFEDGGGNERYSKEATQLSQNPVYSSHGDITINNNTRVSIKLRSIKALRDEVIESSHAILTDMFADHTFVGVVDTARRLVAIQYGIKLYLVDYGAVCKKLFYQIGLSDFGNFGTIWLAAKRKFDSTGVGETGSPLNGDNGDGIRVESLLDIAYESLSPTKPSLINKEDGLRQLINMRDMLFEYFTIHITSDGMIVALPLLLKGYIPPINKLPAFIYRLVNNVNWEVEEACFKNILTELAMFYIPECIDECVDNSEDNDNDNERVNPRLQSIKHDLERLIFPAIKKRLIGTKTLLKDIVEVANLPGLYRVFERC
ncbi:DNA mismatch repair protein MutL [Nadsonia fulvescens var. elongata DSM 6958]|uniref:DNA mismatch repair protein MutL n=1 Tax=Nadsonia fulvescens var. elongata DSM 6958 TaxID=857566 RepID=A0A1E3PP95_9ASCO|nr:DNA mismatch repair protein MutL [Nadsonia fulvescens var. elongata DSM 6958]